METPNGLRLEGIKIQNVETSKGSAVQIMFEKEQLAYTLMEDGEITCIIDAQGTVRTACLNVTSQSLFAILNGLKDRDSGRILQ